MEQSVLPARDWLTPYSALYETNYESFEAMKADFDWEYPDAFNAATYLCDIWADDEGRVALIYEDHTSGREGSLTFRELADYSNKLANYFVEQGIERGDRVAVHTPQKIETVLSHLALWKIGAVSVPLSVLYGPEAIDYRLTDSGCTMGVVDRSNLDAYRDVVRTNDSMRHTLVVGDGETSERETLFWESFEEYPSTYETATTELEDTMLILYSSGTTGPPKGIIQPHRCVIGHLTGTITNLYNCRMEDDEVLWTPSEWAWGAAISNMFAALFFGRPIVAYETGDSFEPTDPFAVIEKYGVTNMWVVPSALRMMKRVRDPSSRFNLDSVRVIASGGESLVPSVQQWAKDTFEAPIHEAYGLSETFNWNIGDCSAYREVEPETMGFALPGHDIAILDRNTHTELGSDEEGVIALDADNPTLFSRYLNKPEKTEKSYVDGWFITGDLATRDEDGRFRFLGREDDIIISAGYRIGPEEIEDTLIDHDAIADAGVIGVPDDERGEIPKAFIVLDGREASDLPSKSQIKSYVKETLAAYEYPRAIEFVEDLPRTTSGKVRRSELREWEDID